MCCQYSMTKVECEAACMADAACITYNLGLVSGECELVSEYTDATVTDSTLLGTIGVKQCAGKPGACVTKP
jgi:hypothetical protein